MTNSVYVLNNTNNNKIYRKTDFLKLLFLNLPVFSITSKLNSICRSDFIFLFKKTV